MNKSVCYLYAYQGGKRVQNVGFVKCERYEKRAVLQIYGKGFPVSQENSYELFIYYPEGENCTGVSMGTLKSTSPVFSYRLEYDAEDMEGQEYFDKAEGLAVLRREEEHQWWYVAEWGNKELNVEQMKSRADLETAQEEVLPEEVHNVKEEEPQEVREEEPQIGEEISTCEEPITKEEPKANDVIFKITRQDMAKLPRCEWKLANNHFLLHGYHNYHHLISFEKDGTCWLGVPGVFHPKEQKVAKAFGFEQFMRPEEGEIELTGEQREETDEFGYWCRNVSAVVREEK